VDTSATNAIERFRQGEAAPAIGSRNQDYATPDEIKGLHVVDIQ
jgi:hypothetical protein